MARSPSPVSSSKRRRYDEGSPRDDRTRDRSRDRRPDSGRDRGYDREDRDRRRERDSDKREPERERSGHSSRRYDDDSHRSSSRRHERSRSRSRDRDRDRDSRDSRPRSRSRSRDRSSRDHRSRRHRAAESRPRSDYSRSHSPEKREDDRSPRPRADSPASSLRAKSSFVSTFSTPSGSTLAPSSAPGSPLADSKAKDEAEKLRIKQEKLAAWKATKAKAAAEKAAATPPPPVAAAPPTPAKALPPKPATLAAAALPAKPAAPQAGQPVIRPAFVLSSSDPAARALAAAAAISNRLSTPAASTLKPPSSSLPAKPSFSFASTTTTAFRPSGLKNSLVALGEDVEERGIRMVQLDGEVDMTVETGDDGDDDEEDLEGGVVFKAREGGRDARPDVDMVDGTADPSGAAPEPSADAMAEEVEEEEDELEAFMSGVQAKVKNVDKEDKAKLAASSKGKKTALAGPEAADDEDEVESEDEVDKVGLSAAEILAIAAKKVKRGRELHSVDHSKIAYEPFRKAFYHAPPEVEELTPEQVEEMRLEMDGIKVRGADPPKPVAKWSYCGLPAPCIEVIRGLEYAAPTSIQAQAIPAIMSGRDIIGVAKTGSGKTIAFLLPMFRHIKDQRPIKSLEGPIAMIMTPTRELATQIHRECKPFLKALGLRASVAYGGTPLKDNIADMKRGSELVVCTPGRMIELLTTNSGRIINMHRITYIVLDEADRMFDMGFEPQVMKIINQIRPDRQTVLFSATFPRQMEALARKILRRPLEITVGGRSIVAPEIEQIVEVRAEDTKFNRLLELLGRLSNEDSDARTLIFVERQDSADKLLQELLKKNYACMSLHGGMEQVDRDQAITDFKSGIIPVVIATSVAARGLDVKQLKLVVQYDAPNHMEDYVHRAGRTGRAGNKGTCVTFVTPDQDRYALDIFKALTASEAKVPDELKTMAEAFAEKVKSGKASAAGSGFGGKGLESLADGRDAVSRAQHAMFSDDSAGDKKPTAAAVEDAAKSAVEVADMEIEIKRGPAPDMSKRGGGGGSIAAGVQDATSLAKMKADEAAAIAAGKPAGVAKAQSVIANFNAMLKAKSAGRSGESDLSTDSARRRDPDATDFHAIIYINDYPQKARWKVTNKETMVQLVESTGASITNKGTYYEPGKEPGPDELPKLHLLIESNEEFRVKHAISEIKRSLIEGATMALEAEQRNPGTAPGRYTV